MSDAEVFERLYAAAMAGEDVTQVPGVTVDELQAVVDLMRLDREASTAATVAKALALAENVERWLEDNP